MFPSRWSRRLPPMAPPDEQAAQEGCADDEPRAEGVHADRVSFAAEDAEAYRAGEGHPHEPPAEAFDVHHLCQEVRKLKELCSHQSKELRKLKDELSSFKEKIDPSTPPDSRNSSPRGTRSTAPPLSNQKTSSRSFKVLLKGLASVSKQAKDRKRMRESYRKEQVTLKHSIWDAAILVGSRYTDGVLVSATLIVLLVLNLLMQSTFLIILSQSGLIQPQLDAETVAQYEDWRANVAHDLSNYDSRLRRSLASRVCRGDASVPSSAIQFQAYSNLNVYIGAANESTILSVGPLMTMLALSMWLLSSGRGMREITNLTIALWHVKRAARTHFKVKGVDGAERVNIASISLERLLFAYFVIGVRIAISFTLCVFGCLYLIHTTVLEDLLLNAVALDLVLNFDELLFEVLAPVRVARLIEFTEPLYIHRVFHWYGLDWKTPVYLVSVFGSLALLMSAFVSPQMDVLVKARDALCGGDQAFVSVMDGLGITTWTYPDGSDASVLNARNPDGGTPSQSYGALGIHTTFTRGVAQVLLQQQGRTAWEGCDIDSCYLRSNDPLSPNTYYFNVSGPDCCIANALRAPDMTVLEQVARASLSESARLWNPGCHDILEASLLPYVPYSIQGRVGEALLTATGGKSQGTCDCPINLPVCRKGKCTALECSDVQAFCNDVSEMGLLARATCPVSCGCTEPRSALVQQCEDFCLRSGAFLTSLQTMPCEDVPLDDSTFSEFLDGLEVITSQMMGGLRKAYAQEIRAFQKMGCKFLNATSSEVLALGARPPFEYGFNPCWGELSFSPFIKPFAYFCPASCGCRRGDPHCPGTCPARTASEPICTDSQREGGASGSNSCPSSAWGAADIRIS